MAIAVQRSPRIKSPTCIDTDENSKNKCHWSGIAPLHFDSRFRGQPAISTEAVRVASHVDDKLTALRCFLVGAVEGQLRGLIDDSPGVKEISADVVDSTHQVLLLSGKGGGNVDHCDSAGLWNRPVAQTDTTIHRGTVNCDCLLTSLASSAASLLSSMFAY